jgi:Protein of unknown function (DUF3311)
MSRWPLVLLVAAVYVLHQDFWFWRQARPLLFGFMPVGLFYHVCYTLAVSMTMWLLVRYSWPHHLDDESVPGSKGRRVEESRP